MLRPGGLPGPEPPHDPGVGDPAGRRRPPRPGRVAQVVGTPGDPDRPLPDEALREKFRRCAEPAFGQRWEAAWRAARRPDRLADLSALF